MKPPFVALLLLLSACAQAADSVVPASTHRYLVERTFPKGALDHLDAQTKQSVNSTNAKFGVTWVTSYANADRTKTFCVYEGPNESAIRAAAIANQLPLDSITEIPLTLDAKP